MLYNYFGVLIITSIVGDIMENKMNLLKYIIVSFLLYPVMSNAHGGRTDMIGRHNNIVEQGYIIVMMVHLLIKVDFMRAFITRL